jgi:hypothetical protein
METAELLKLDYGNVIFTASWDDSLQKKTADNLFWQEWLNKKYGLALKEANINYRVIAEKLSIILEQLKTSNTVISIPSLYYLLLMKKDITLCFKEKNNSFLSFYDIRKVPREYDISFEGNDSVENFIKVSSATNNNVPISHSPFVSQLTPTGKRNYKKILDKILVPTTYITGKGELKVIGYNVDIDSYIQSSLIAQLGKDKKWDALKEIGEAIFLKYFY